ncbi:MAG: hypothetical protein AAGL66_18600 [Pseudomonadota bacterium]
MMCSDGVPLKAIAKALKLFVPAVTVGGPGITSSKVLHTYWGCDL